MTVATEVHRAKRAQSTARSEKLYERASRVLPEGVSSSGKARKPYPIYVKEAMGARVVDVDGNEYLDFLLSFGALILGHAHPAVISSVRRQLGSGLALGAPTEAEVELAEKISKHIKSAEMLRFANSGTEAVNYALRVARGYTGKDRVAKFEGGFHGNFDNVLISVTASSSNTVDRLYSLGIGEAVSNETLALPFNDADGSASLIEKNADRLAAVVVEVVQGFSGCIPATGHFLSALRKVTRDNEVLLILDEVQTTFRLGLEGAQSHFRIVPDMVVLGKIIGGGFPIGAYGGSKNIMQMLIPDEKRATRGPNRVFQSGTFNGHPLAMAAGLATISELEKGSPATYSRLDSDGRRLREGLEDAAKRYGIDFQVVGVAPSSMRSLPMTRLPMCEMLPRQTRRSLRSSTIHCSNREFFYLLDIFRPRIPTGTFNSFSMLRTVQ